MIRERPYWIEKIRVAWRRRPIVWLSGARRSGKTTLARMIGEAEILNCDLPSTARRLADPEAFFDGLPRGRVVVFDEVHRLEDPSLLLKIGADAHPHLKILATGSSTLAATRKFRDSLTGRKTSIYLPPVLWTECLEIFDVRDLDLRLLHGGLPEALLSPEKDGSFFSEWLDSFYARDIQELFAIRSRAGFLKLLHLILDQNGGLVDYTSLARLCELSRPTVVAHIEAMRIANAVFLLPPYSGKGRREIVRRPKAYAFDTGFLTFVKGWDGIREEDRGILWENLVLDALRSAVEERALHYWRDKTGREVDFVIGRGSRGADVVECKISPAHVRLDGIVEFRRLYPAGRNFIACPFVKTPYARNERGLHLRFAGLQSIIPEIQKA